jgi:hypothetical protein
LSLELVGTRQLDFHERDRKQNPAAGSDDLGFPHPVDAVGDQQPGACPELFRRGGREMMLGGNQPVRSFMKKILLALATAAICSVSMAQVGTTVKEGAKATAEKAKQAGDETKAAVSSEPNKSVDKAKAQVHKAKAHHHAKAAKDAAKEIPK